MGNERTICCCGASSWVRVIACFEIVGYVLMIIGSIAAFNGQGASENHALFAEVAISFVTYVLGLIMAIVLLNGTNNRNVGCIRAWIIFKVVAAIIAIILMIVTANAFSSATTGTSTGGDIMADIIVVIVAIVVNGFCIGVAYIHIKEIKAGVFK